MLQSRPGRSRCGSTSGATLVLRLSATFAAQQRAGACGRSTPTLVAHALAAMTEWSAFTHLVLGEPPGEGVSPRRWSRP